MSGTEGQSEAAVLLDAKIRVKAINFVVPLAGRWEVFVSFMRNYEEVCLRRKERTRLVVVLFESEYSEKVGDLRQSQAIRNLFDRLSEEYGLKAESTALNLVINTGI